MKGKMVFLSLVLLLVFSCASNPIATNLMTSEVNAENYCVISFHWHIIRIEINGKKYPEVPLFPSFFGQTSIVYILPPGHYKIAVEFKENVNQNEYRLLRNEFELESKNGQYYYFVPLISKGAYTTIMFNETNPSVWSNQKMPSISDTVADAQERRKNVEKKLGIK